MALPAYRHLLRAARIAFQGDERVLVAARQQIRQGFRHNAGLELTDPALRPAIAKAEDMAKILRENVVQGKQEGPNLYKLRIHKDTERGDNDTVTMAGGSTGASAGCGCQ